MSVEGVETMHSKPVYAALPPPLVGERRVLVTQDASLAEAVELHGQLSADGQPVELASCATFDGLTVRVLSLLSSSPVGTRLYVCGDESFLWRIHAVARDSGLLDEEIHLVKVGQQRDLYCVHCATRQHIAAESAVTCSGCGVRLTVREHFSRRLGAYMGVCLDPDQPHGEIQP
jgi:hypothetical protein